MEKEPKITEEGYGMFSRDEMRLIRGIFKDNPNLIKAVRKFFFQGEMTAEEKNLLGMVKSLGGVKILKKCLLPEIDPESPLFQFADVFNGISTKDRNTEFVNMEIESKLILAQYLQGQFEILEGRTEINDVNLKELINFENKEPVKRHIQLGCRNALLIHIDTMMQMIKTLSEIKEETADERSARLKKDSSK